MANKCINCKVYGVFSNPEYQENHTYCKLHEKKEDINPRSKSSPRIEEFFEIGCDDFH